MCMFVGSVSSLNIFLAVILGINELAFVKEDYLMAGIPLPFKNVLYGV